MNEIYVTGHRNPDTDSIVSGSISIPPALSRTSARR